MKLYILVLFNEDKTIGNWIVELSLRNIVHHIDSGRYHGYRLFCLDFRETRMSIEEMKI